MEQDRAVAKILRDLVQFQLVKDDDKGQVRIHLNRLYTTGWEEGIKEASDYKRKIVIQENSSHQQIGEYFGIDNASTKLRINRTVIERSIKFKRLTKKGHYWKYKEGVT